MDKAKPEIEIPNVPSEYYRRYEYVLDVNVSDEDSGVASVTLPDGIVVTGEDLTSVTYTVTDNGTYTFTVVDNVGNEETITITITHLQAEQSMRLVDSRGRPLQGGVFELYWDGKLIDRKETDVNGVIDFGLLYTSGEYELKQVRVLDGYRLNSEVIDFQVPDIIEVTNYQKSEELPSTGTMDTLIILVIVLASITVIIVTNKKRRKISKEE